MAKNYSFLSSQYDSLFKKNIEQFCDNICKKNDYKSEKYCLFYPSFGTSEKEEIDFVVYGQATKGWTPEFQLLKYDSEKLIGEAKEYSNTIDRGMLNPIDWININWSKKAKERYAKDLIIDYHACKSFFWNVTYKLISDYYQIDRKKPDWSGKIVWSNLMKIAPAARLNPNDAMYKAQVGSCVNLFKQELEEIQPKYAVLLTNLSWAESFIKDLDTISLPENNFIDWMGYYMNTLVIVTKRPFCGPSDKYVDEILNLIRSSLPGHI